MGRYYSGDIEGKFWFAVQSSDCADRFGVQGTTPNYLDYWFDETNLEDIKNEIKEIKDNLGKQTLKLLDKFFNENNGYNPKTLIEFFKEQGSPKTEGDIQYMLQEYADLGIGKQILECVEKNGECLFKAET